LYKGQPQLLDLLDCFKNNSKISLQKLIDEVSKVDVWQAENTQSLCKDLSIFIVFNQIRKMEEAQTSYRLKKVCQKQLNLDLKYPGFVFLMKI